MTISLQDIQTTLKVLWLDNEACEDYFSCDGANCPTDNGIEKLRRSADRQGVELYGRLLRYGWHDVMSSIYPLCEQVLGDQWHGTVDSYIRVYPPRHFNLNRLAEHFSCYLASHEDKLVTRFPFISQLADYEWLELEVLEHPSIVLKEACESLSTVEQFGRLVPIVNPTLSMRRYQYSLLEIADAIERGENLSSVPNETKETNVAFFRLSGSSRCKIVEFSNLALTVVETAIRKEVRTYGEIARHAISLCEELPSQDVALKFIDLIENLHEMDVFVGQHAL